MEEVFFISWPTIRCHVIFDLIEGQVIRLKEDSKTRPSFVASGTRNANVIARGDHLGGRSVQEADEGVETWRESAGRHRACPDRAFPFKRRNGEPLLNFGGKGDDVGMGQWLDYPSALRMSAQPLATFCACMPSRAGLI
jgi:hypothetical protein